MEMTLSRLGLTDMRAILTGTVLPIGILALIAMMVLPLPAILLDVFFVANILVSLLILMVAINTFRPLDFSSFPSLLLIATVLRLGLNVASTRIVLSRGHEGTDAAGQVIEAFGAFVISGNYAVGIFVFIILIIINLVVITRGAGRVSEVSARFTLDAMPGKQMAIDADLNAGVLTTEEAARRREEIANEADFYGAMDGASKFVKGDAVAALLILAVNIIGGLIIGLSQHDMNIGTAAEIYLMLSVGDGLVAQIPSLLLAIATAIIVTRVSSTQNMAAHIGRQVSISSAWIPVAGVMFLIGFVPGMPNFLFLIAASIAAAAAYFVQLSEQKTDVAQEEPEEEVEEKAPDQIELSDVTDNAPISVQIGYGLVEMVDEDAGGPLVNRITSIRKQVSKTLGFVVPPVRIRDDLSLKANQYRIRIGQTIVGEDEAFPNRKLAIPGENSQIQLDGQIVKDPTFGMDAIWIRNDQEAEAEANNYVVVAPEAVIATHLSSLLYKSASELIGQDDVQTLLDNLAQTNPNLVESVVPKIVPLHELTGILRLLLKERVPISDLRRILEALPPLSARNLSMEETAEALRPELASLLIQQVAPLNMPLPVITFDGELEHMLINMQRQSPDGELILDTELAQKLLESLTRVNEQLSAEGKQAVVVVSPVIRRSLARVIRQHIDDMVVIAFSELPETRKVDVVATIGGETDQTAV
ncbi:MAG TPA: flagellar biosynthesis protein FlhA [Rhodobiaceae bacterium]|nr:MAG: Flagellar biosynthesis protein FlhA [Rhodobiaceae bacterium UBA7378]HCQ81469.1 flagellar biosynthesis protein FlhA [Rhodobiaceae bacterium]